MISIIIPTLNEEKVLDATLRALSRYRGEHEIIISDGGSNDSTIAIARRYTDKIVVHSGSARQTIGEGRNAGARLARREYLVFFDADVIVPDVNKFFERAIPLFKATDGLLGITGPVRVQPELATFTDTLVFAGLNMLICLYNNVFGIGAAAGEFQMIRASAFKELGGFNEKLVGAEDFEMFARLRTRGRTLYAPALGVYHSGRRAHNTGWPKLLWLWFRNWLTMVLNRKSASKEWKIVR